MAVTYIGGAVPAGNPTTSFSVSTPTVQVDDVIIIAATNRDSTADPGISDNDTGGNTWAKLGGDTTGLTVWWKRATSGSSNKTASLTGFTGSTSGCLAVFRGCTTSGNPFENVTTESNASGSPSHAGFTPSGDGAMIVICVANRTNDIATSAFVATNPSTITGRQEKLSTGGSDCSNRIAADAQTTAAATGTISWTQTAAASVSCAFNLIASSNAYTLTAAQGTLALTGQAANLNRGFILMAAQGTLALAGQAVTLTFGYTLTAAQGTLALAGQASTLTAQRTLTAAQGTLVLAGQSANLNHGFRIVATQGALALTGQSANLNHGFILAAAQGTFALVGQASTFTAQRTLTVAQGTLALTGQAVNLLRGVRLTAAQGTLALTGFNAGLNYSGGAPTLVVEVGVLSLAGQAVTLTAQRKLIATQSGVTLAGQNANLLRGVRLVAAQGSLALAGQASILAAQRRLAAAQGTLVLAGQSANLQYSSGGAYTLICQAGRLSIYMVHWGGSNWCHARHRTTVQIVHPAPVVPSNNPFIIHWS